MPKRLEASSDLHWYLYIHESNSWHARSHHRMFFFFFCCSWVMATINISTQPSRIRLLGDGGQINLRDAPLDFYGGRGWFLGKNSLLAVEMKTKIVCFVGFVGLGKKGLVKKMFPIPTPTPPPQTKMVANKILFCPPIYNGASLSTQSRVQR